MHFNFFEPMKVILLVLISLLSLSKFTVAQVDSTNCEFRYSQWEKLLEENGNSMDFIERNAELIGGKEELYKNIDRPKGSFTGMVIVKFLIDEEGIPSCFEFIRKYQNMFDTAAVNAIKKSKFKPALANGKPVPIAFVLPINFTIQN